MKRALKYLIWNGTYVSCVAGGLLYGQEQLLNLAVFATWCFAVIHGTLLPVAAIAKKSIEVSLKDPILMGDEKREEMRSILEKFNEIYARNTKTFKRLDTLLDSIILCMWIYHGHFATGAAYLVIYLAARLHQSIKPTEIKD